MESEHPEHTSRPRLLLKPEAIRSGCVDGAWWPRSEDLASELPELLAALQDRLGSIDSVSYKVGDWAKRPSSLLFDGRAVDLGGNRRQPPNTLEVIGLDRSRIVLLVVPPHTSPDRAHAGMAAAAAPEDTSTVDELLMISLQDREHRTRRGAAEQRWDSHGNPPPSAESSDR